MKRRRPLCFRFSHQSATRMPRVQRSSNRRNAPKITPRAIALFIGPAIVHPKKRPERARRRTSGAVAVRHPRSPGTNRQATFRIGVLIAVATTLLFCMAMIMPLSGVTSIVLVRTQSSSPIVCRITKQRVCFGPSFCSCVVKRFPHFLQRWRRRRLSPSASRLSMTSVFSPHEHRIPRDFPHIPFPLLYGKVPPYEFRNRSEPLSHVCRAG